MTERDDETGEAADDSDAAVRVLHFDPDETVLARLRSYVEESYDDVAYEVTTDVAGARDALGDGGVDVFVVESDAPGDVADLVAAADAPVVLYTGSDPSEVDPAVFDRADSVVEKWTAEEGLQFVAEKIRCTARSADADGTRFTRAFDRVDPATERSSCFLVYADGTVIWESTSLATLLAERGVEVSVPGTPNFYRQLTALLSQDPAAIRAIRGPDVPSDPTEFTLPTADGRARFRYSEHEFPETLGPLRLVVVEDVTGAARSGARLELLELLDEHVGDGVSVVDANGRVVYHNESFADMLGREDMVGEHSAAHMADGELAAGQRALQRFRESDRDSEVIDMTFETADGEERTLAVHFSARGSGDDYDGLVNVARDVTDRRARERRLERYRRLVERTADPMYVADPDRRVEVCNEAMAALFDRPAESLAGTPLSDLFPGEAVERIRGALDDARAAGERRTCECTLPSDAGDPRRFEVTVAGLCESDGGSVGVLHEVTERERRASELDLLKQVLTRVLRHDVRTGLTVVRGHAEVLAERTSGEEREMAETIVDRSERLAETADKARAIERVIDSDEGRVTLDLRSVVNRAVADVAADHADAEYDVRITERVPVRVHPAFPYAVENLVENSVAHSEGAASVAVSAAVDGDAVDLRVTDDGPGITRAELDVLENREETPLEHGTGVGLWLVDWVVERSGGDLSFDTGPDGTTVTVRLDAGEPGDLA